MKVRRVDDLRRLRGRMPWTLAAFGAGALSMIGIPPFCGFFSKWYLLMGALEADRMIYAAVIVGSSLLSAGYFFRCMDRFGFYHEEGGPHRRAEPPAAMIIPIILLAVALVAMGLGSNWIRTVVVEPAPYDQIVRHARGPQAHNR